jgi:hypothetical protein
MRQMKLVVGVAVGLGLLALTSGSAVQAADIAIPAGTIGLQTVPGKFVSVQNFGKGNFALLTVSFNLSTCVDKLLPVSYTTEKRGNQTFVYISGINARGDASAVLCTPGPYVAKATVQLPGIGYSANTVKVVNLTQLGRVVN